MSQPDNVYRFAPRAEAHGELFDTMISKLGIRRSQERLMKRVLSDDAASTLEQAAELSGVPEEVLAQGWALLLQRSLAGLPVLHLNYSQLYQLSVEAKDVGPGLNTSVSGPLSLVQRTGERRERVLVIATGFDARQPAFEMARQSHQKIIVATSRTVQCAYYRYIKPPIEEFWRSLADMEAEDITVSSAGEVAVERAWVALLRHAAFLGASDVQLLCSGTSGAIKLRTDGVYGTLRYVKRRVYDLLLTRLMGLVNVTDEALASNVLREGTFDPENRSLRPLFDLQRLFVFRPIIGVGASGKTATIRILNRAGAVSNFDALGFSTSDAGYLRGLMDLGDGLILLSGPTGSGKTNTLDALVQLIDPEGRSVQTLENPVEFVDPRRLQYEMRSHVTNVSEANVAQMIIVGMLRNDPDVIIVGEVRTSEMTSLLLRASRTGHLVLGTVHADDAGGTVYQLQQWGVSAEDIASQLRAIIALRLIRLLCDACKVQRTPVEVDALLAHENYEVYKPVFDEVEAMKGTKDWKAQWWRAFDEGCSECSGTGYRGRRLIYELLRGDAKTKTAIREGATSVGLNRKSFSIWQTLSGRALLLVMMGQTSIEEVRATHSIDSGHVAQLAEARKKQKDLVEQKVLSP